MPTFKHPCPRCGNFIQRDVQVCPFCGTPDPFAPGRCPNCRKILDDPKWVACPNCGASLVAPPPGTVPAAPAPGPVSGGSAARPGALWGPNAVPAQAPRPAVPAPPAPVQGPPTQPPAWTPPAGQAPQAPPAGPVASAPVAATRTCRGCGAPLSAGARFCTSCGTLAG